MVANKAGIYQMEAPYGSQLLHQAPSLAHNYKTGVEVKESGKHSILLGQGINYGHVIRNILDLMLIELSYVMPLVRTITNVCNKLECLSLASISSII